MKYLYIAAVALLLVVTGSYMSNILPGRTFGSTSLVNSQACTASTSVEALVSTASTQILATSSRRAWARIENTDTTNGVAVAFEDDKIVSASNALLLLPATANADNSIDFGLSTDYPYVAAVRASTTVGAVNVRVTQCFY